LNTTKTCLWPDALVTIARKMTKATVAL